MRVEVEISFSTNYNFVYLLCSFVVYNVSFSCNKYIVYLRRESETFLTVVSTQ